MSQSRTATGAARGVGAGVGRIMRVWRVLPFERRLAALAAIGLFLTLFLPWYQETVVVKGRARSLQAASVSVTGWGAFSFAEAAVLLVAAGVLTLLFQRAEGHAFHLPGGDGGVITAAGVWTCVLVVWRIFDKQVATSSGQLTNTSGIEWGIFIALAVAALLAYSGSRIRLAHRPEPPLPGEKTAEGPSPLGGDAEPDGGWQMEPAWETSGAWEAGAARTEPLPRPPGSSESARRGRTERRAELADLPRPQPEDPPAY